MLCQGLESLCFTLIVCEKRMGAGCSAGFWRDGWLDRRTDAALVRARNSRVSLGFSHTGMAPV